jgi:glutamate synthase (NADPH/NADH) large chain
VVEELREIMAKLGIRTHRRNWIGQTHLHDSRQGLTERQQRLDLRPLLSTEGLVAPAQFCTEARANNALRQGPAGREDGGDTQVPSRAAAAVSGAIEVKQLQSLDRRPRVGRDRAAHGNYGMAAMRHHVNLSGSRGAELRRLERRGSAHERSKAKPTTTSARAWPAASWC